MMLEISSREQHAQPPAVFTVVLRYQELYLNWSALDTAEQDEDLQWKLEMCLEELWGLLEPSLQQVARHWQRSPMARDIRATPSEVCVQDVLVSLAMNSFYYIIEALPSLQVDPRKNLLACLKTIAYRGLCDEYKNVYRETTRRNKNPTSNLVLAPGAHEAGMWTEKGHHPDQVQSIDTLSEQIDPQSCDAEDRLIEAIDNQILLRAVYQFWQTLSPENLQVVTMRCRNPPVPYEDVVERLGPGWTTVGARQRYHRIIHQTRRYLQANDLLDDFTSSVDIR